MAVFVLCAWCGGVAQAAASDLNLWGTARKTFLSFPVVTVSLYGPKSRPSDILSDVPKRIEVNYHVRISKKELDRATIRGIRRNYTPDEYNALLPRIREINACYTDVKPGDQIAVTYTPGIGTEVRLNGQRRGLIEGPDFAQAFFAIWVGSHPVDTRAKSRLLGVSS